MERAVKELTAPAAPVIDAYVYVTRARLHVLARDLGSAERDLVAARELIGHLEPINPSALSWRSLAGVVAHRCGDDERARELIHDEIRLAALFEVPVALGVALRRRALTETGERACRTFRKRSPFSRRPTRPYSWLMRTPVWVGYAVTPASAPALERICQSA